jgi:class 3 adenylate cyclase
VTHTRTGTITILFTDLVGSTELMDRMGEEEGRKLISHYLSHLREISAAYLGQEVKNLGDGIEVAFSSVLSALDAVTSMQRAIHWENSERETNLALRAGMNVCEASIADGDYWGLSVVVAKRLCDMAEGDQILVSGLVADLAADHSEWRFEPLGHRALRGISRSVATFELQWAPLDHIPTLPSPSATSTEHQGLSRFIRSVRRNEGERRSR